MLIRKRKRPLFHRATLGMPDNPLYREWHARHTLDTPLAVMTFVESVLNDNDLTLRVQALIDGILGLLVHHRLDDVSKAAGISTSRLRDFIYSNEEPNLDETLCIYAAFGLNFFLQQAPMGRSLSKHNVIVGA